MTSRKPAVSIRRPSQPDPAVVEQFVNSGTGLADPQPSGRSGTTTPEDFEVQTRGQPEVPTSQRPRDPTSTRSEHPMSGRPDVSAPECLTASASGYPGNGASRPPEPLVPNHLEDSTSERPGTKLAEGSRAPTPQRSGGQTPRRRGLVQRQDGRVRRRMTVYLPPDLARELAVRCAATGEDISDAVSAAVQAYLARVSPEVTAASTTDVRDAQ